MQMEKYQIAAFWLTNWMDKDFGILWELVLHGFSLQIHSIWTDIEFLRTESLKRFKAYAVPLYICS